MPCIQKKIVNVLFSFCFLIGTVVTHALPLPQTLIPITDKKGQQLFKQAEIKQDFFQLIPYAVTQHKLSYCGIASSVIALNALAVPAPIAQNIAPYHLFTQNNLFSHQSGNPKIKKSIVEKQGLSLDELGQLLKNSGAFVDVIPASKLKEIKFIKLIKSALQNPAQIVLVNYYRKSLGLPGGGHISPIAAYDKQSNRFLLLEVSRYKYPPFWVSADQLWRATNTYDNNIARGLVIVSNTAFADRHR